MLAEIPIELLLMIADCLSRDDVTCISLCNHRLFAVFPYQTDAVSTSGEKDQLEHKLAVINRLQRDLPHYFLCYVCNHLHKQQAQRMSVLKSLARRTSENVQNSVQLLLSSPSACYEETPLWPRIWH